MELLVILFFFLRFYQVIKVYFRNSSGLSEVPEESLQILLKRFSKED